MDNINKKEIADKMNKKFLIQVEYYFDEDSHGFRRKVDFLEDSTNVARIEIINMLRANFGRIQKSIGKEVDDIIISMISELLDEHQMREMKANADSIFGEDGFMKGFVRED
tara:strand:+ start:323 stop:655 length:333 start_codon:yes stop_codon:yes gene_type:complete